MNEIKEFSELPPPETDPIDDLILLAVHERQESQAQPCPQEVHFLPWLSQELSHDDAIQFEDHLSRCSACRAAFRAVKPENSPDLPQVSVWGRAIAVAIFDPGSLTLRQLTRLMDKLSLRFPSMKRCLSDSTPWAAIDVGSHSLVGSPVDAGKTLDWITALEEVLRQGDGPDVGILVTVGRGLLDQHGPFGEAFDRAKSLAHRPIIGKLCLSHEVIPLFEGTHRRLLPVDNGSLWALYSPMHWEMLRTFTPDRSLRTHYFGHAGLPSLAFPGLQVTHQFRHSSAVRYARMDDPEPLSTPVSVHPGDRLDIHIQPPTEGSFVLIWQHGPHLSLVDRHHAHSSFEITFDAQCGLKRPLILVSSSPIVNLADILERLNQRIFTYHDEPVQCLVSTLIDELDRSEILLLDLGIFSQAHDVPILPDETLVLAMASRNYAHAESMLRQRIAAQRFIPEHHSLFLELANAVASQGKFFEGLEILARAELSAAEVLAHRSRAAALEKIGEIQLLRENSEEARNALTMAYKLFSRNEEKARVLVKLAKLDQRDGNDITALATYRQVLHIPVSKEVGGHRADAHKNIALMLASQTDRVNARAHAMEARLWFIQQGMWEEERQMAIILENLNESSH